MKGGRYPSRVPSMLSYSCLLKCRMYSPCVSVVLFIVVTPDIGREVSCSFSSAVDLCDLMESHWLSTETFPLNLKYTCIVVGE